MPRFANQGIGFIANCTPHPISAPKAVLSLVSAATKLVTWVGAGTDTWNSSVPVHCGGSNFTGSYSATAVTTPSLP
jgi:hypothetical protein